jgi:hypothetical protein
MSFQQFYHMLHSHYAFSVHLLNIWRRISTTEKKWRLVEPNHTANLTGPSFQCRRHCTSNYLTNSIWSSCHPLRVTVTKSLGFYRKVKWFIGTEVNGYRAILIEQVSTCIFPFHRVCNSKTNGNLSYAKSYCQNIKNCAAHIPCGCCAVH